ncbi:hypothetical protein N9Z55_03280 [Akkermansiaceae bacterium]|jgi:hypothetical protein|nr:hypothetical protein [Akkermansiaceae bacterium]MDA7639796.1 hypothetical protein [Akkermansiaceae bacterium]MDA7659890.1 hypothetical protein [Akkermansiaceae bacterium]MDB4354900.1 hypothetical protein [Akkermansiaceae bacterium]MDB4377131.1 hypothetical protein [Akkermansiaceae bacterium]
MAIGFPAYHTEIYSPSDDRSDLRSAVKLTLSEVSWLIRKETQETIEASTSLNLRSWGEKIIITFLSNGSISVTSKCALPTQLFDWGKNETNIKKFMAELKKQDPVQSLSPPPLPVDLPEEAEQ